MAMIGGLIPDAANGAAAVVACETLNVALVSANTAKSSMRMRIMITFEDVFGSDILRVNYSDIFICSRHSPISSNCRSKERMTQGAPAFGEPSNV